MMISMFQRGVIVTEKFGDLGNRLCRFARLFSITQQEGAYLLDLSLFQYSYLFAPKNRAFAFLFRGFWFLNNNRFKKLENFLLHSNHVASSQLNSYPEEGRELSSLKIKQEIRTSSKPILLLTKNSYYVNGDDLSLVKKKLLNIFSLKKKYLHKAATLLSSATASDRDSLDRTCTNRRSLVVAVHIRQGEYKDFADGAYYFEEEVYAASMKNLLLSYHDRERPLRFILITKEAISLESFQGLPFHFFGNQSVGVDQALFQQSDYIISTTSTFSAWPSFLHNIPRGVITSATVPLTWDDFKITDLNF